MRLKRSELRLDVSSWMYGNGEHSTFDGMGRDVNSKTYVEEFSVLVDESRC